MYIAYCVRQSWSRHMSCKSSSCVIDVWPQPLHHKHARHCSISINGMLLFINYTASPAGSSHLILIMMFCCFNFLVSLQVRSTIPLFVSVKSHHFSPCSLTDNTFPLLLLELKFRAIATRYRNFGQIQIYSCTRLIRLGGLACLANILLFGFWLCTVYTRLQVATNDDPPQMSYWCVEYLLQWHNSPCTLITEGHRHRKTWYACRLLIKTQEDHTDERENLLKIVLTMPTMPTTPSQNFQHLQNLCTDEPFGMTLSHS